MERKILKVLLILVIIQLYVGLEPGCAETIYTKDGEVKQAKITEVTETTVWYELTSGDMTEYIGIDKADVVKILNDDGSLSEYSSTYCAPCASGAEEKDTQTQE